MTDFLNIFVPKCVFLPITGQSYIQKAHKGVPLCPNGAFALHIRALIATTEPEIVSVNICFAPDGVQL